MQSLAETRRQMAAIDLIEGLPIEQGLRFFGQGVRLGGVGHYVAAFFAADMFAKNGHEDLGHSRLFQLIESRFQVDRRRTAEYVRVGTRLRILPLISRAFREDRLSWSTVLLLVRVASPEHEAAWIRRAQEVSYPELQNDVKMAVPGGPPRQPGQRRGIHGIQKRHGYTVSVVDHEMIATAQRKLAAELGRNVGEAEFVATLADLFLHLESDGTRPGYKRIDASLYRIVFRPEHVPSGEGPGGEGHEHPEGCGCGAHPEELQPGRAPLLIHTDQGLVPVLDEVLETCIHCDGEEHHFDAQGNPLPEPKTDNALRKKILTRDGFRCACCGSPYRLHVHHIQYLSKDGKTKGYNLISSCENCHSLIHAGLLFLDGENASEIVFVNRNGRPLHQRGERVDAEILLELAAPLKALKEDPTLDLDAYGEPPVTLESIPSTIDGTWWQRHADLIHTRRGQGLHFRPGQPLAEADIAKARADDDDEAKASAFDGLVGQQALLHRLLVAADAARNLGRSFPHTLFVGPPGTGKTTLARGVAAALGGRLIATSGPLLPSGHDLLALLAGLEKGDVFFIDEIHAVPRPVLEILYQAMADGCVDLTFHTGSRVRSTHLELPPFTFLAATTEEGQVPDALCSRFGFREILGYQDETSLAELVTHRAREQEVFVRQGAAKVLARAARGTPREALRLLDRVLDVCALRGDTTLDVAAAHAALASLGYDERGLDARDQRYLALLEESNAPVSMTRILGTLGTDERTLLRHVEPHLFRLGLVEMTPQGRQIVRSKAPDLRHVTEVPNIADDLSGGAAPRNGRLPPPAA